MAAVRTKELAKGLTLKHSTSDGYSLQFKAEGKNQHAMINLDQVGGRIIQSALQGWAEETINSTLSDRDEVDWPQPSPPIISSGKLIFGKYKKPQLNEIDQCCGTTCDKVKMKDERERMCANINKNYLLAKVLTRKNRFLLTLLGIQTLGVLTMICMWPSY